MKTKEPFIGITCDVQMPSGRSKAHELLCDYRYPEAVKMAGGFPVLLPIARRPDVIRRYLEEVDGLIIVGGDDVDPRLYGERPRRGTGMVFRPRLRFECDLYRGARSRQLPILGVCYGMQLLNVLEGGSLYQDIRRDAGARRNHRNRRQPLTRIRIDRDSRLARVLGTQGATVHCEHHQAVRDVAPGFRPVAFSTEGIVEAIEGRSREILAVQWHPERTLTSKVSHRLFRWFVRLCSR